MANWKRIQRVEDVGEHLEVQVNYYRKEDAALIRESVPWADVFVPKKGTVLRISRADLLTYWLFEDKDETDPLSCSYKALSKRAAHAIPALIADFESKDGNLRARVKPLGTERAIGVQTRLGVSVGLAVVNQILALAQADWTKLRKAYVEGKEEKRLDYEYAASIHGYVAVENKGCICADNRRKASSVSQHKRSILAKKEVARTNGICGALLGTIVVADSRKASRLKCWLIDPPLASSEDLRPDVFRILSRLAFHRRLLALIFPIWRSLHLALAKCEEAIRRENDWKKFDGEPLKRPSGDAFHPKWGAHMKPQAETQRGLVVGVLGRCGADYLLFIGIAKQWVDVVIDQSLSKLAEMKDESVSEGVVLMWHAKVKEWDMLKEAGAKISKGEDGFGQVELPATLHRGDSGFAFALIPRRMKNAAGKEQP